MKLTILSTMLAGLFLLPMAHAMENRETREQVVSINDAFIPSGFDSGSDAFVVINGLFPNSCYRFRDAKVEHVGPALHEVKAFAQVTEGLCLMVLVPFSKEVRLGNLEAGEHSVRFVNGDGTHWEKRFTVEN
jgi:hypothetical protein